MSEKPIYEELEQRVRELEKAESERKQAEEALRQNANFNEALLNAVPTPVFYKDRKGRYLGCNRAFMEIMGVTEEEIRGKTVNALWPSEHAKRYHRADLELMEHPEHQVYEFEVKDKDGAIRQVIFTKNVFWDTNGVVAGIVGAFVDITEQKILQAQLIQAQKMEAIGTLAGSIAHNFNNVLMGIQGHASLMMLDNDPSHPDYKHLNAIHESVRMATELTRDLLGFARGGKYEVKPTDLNTLIKHENSMFGRTKKEIQIHGKYEKNLWAVEVDQGQIRQTLLNLYLNAWKAMPDGGDLYIQTENVKLDEVNIRPFEVTPGRYVKISVTDTGIGMDEATRERIFDPFFSKSGTGLGLASVYGIVKNHGGFIDIFSEKGEGTTFNIYIPASEKESVKKDPGPDRYEIQYGTGTVLLVDDEGIIIDVGKKMLERLGYQVLIARNGNEALDVFGKQRNGIDLIILDMIMPGMGGGETYDRLKDIDESVRVLLSSGYSIDGQAKKILDRGCIGFIQKPFSLNALSNKLKESIEEKK